MKGLMTRDQVIDTEYGSYRLRYGMHEINEEGWRYYGVSIFQYYNTGEKKGVFDQAVVKGFSEDRMETQAFFETLFLEKVFPVHLLSIADDWQYVIQGDSWRRL